MEGKLNSEMIWKTQEILLNSEKILKIRMKSEKIWTIWKKGKLNSEKIWKLWKKSKLNNEKIWKIQKKMS